MVVLPEFDEADPEILTWHRLLLREENSVWECSMLPKEAGWLGCALCTPGICSFPQLPLHLWGLVCVYGAAPCLLMLSAHQHHRCQLEGSRSAKWECQGQQEISTWYPGPLPGRAAREGSSDGEDVTNCRVLTWYSALQNGEASGSKGVMWLLVLVTAICSCGKGQQAQDGWGGSGPSAVVTKG